MAHLAPRRYPSPALRVGQWFKRLPSDFPIPFEVWETFVMPHMVTRDYKPPATTVQGRLFERLRSRGRLSAMSL